MIEKPMDVLTLFPVRKSAKQKAAFREAVGQYVASLGCKVTVEKGSMGSRNLIFGDPENAEYLITAHYDTCAGMLFPNFITPFNFFVYFAYQLFLVLLFAVAAKAVGWPVAELTNDIKIGYYAGMAVYFGLLIIMMMGPSNKHNANDNTSGVVTLLQTLTAMPEELRDKVCFVLFDLEEAGLVGSSSYRKKHKNPSDGQIVLNLDCVGDGDELFLIPSKKLIRNSHLLERLKTAEREEDGKAVKVHQKGYSMYPSDQKHFPYGVGICALKRGRLGLYMDRIHTAKDTVLDEKNVNVLCKSLIDIMASQM